VFNIIFSQIIELYEIWHYKTIEQYDPVSREGGLFTEYVNAFMKIKQVG